MRRFIIELGTAYTVLLQPKASDDPDVGWRDGH